MCSISGFIITDPTANRQQIATIYQEILARGAERGKDSAGILTMNEQGVVKRHVEIAPQEYDFVQSVISDDCQLLIANNRAEPTTEYVKEKQATDAQPFGNGTIYISHNGTIANDHELRERFNIPTETRIDSAVCPEVIHQLGVEKGLDALNGSFSLAIVDRRQPQKLWLARNYKPLFLQARPEVGAIFFASLSNHFGEQNDLFSQLYQPAIIAPPAYSLLELDGATGQIKETDFAPRIRNKKALIICSGGLDSTTCAKWAQLQGYEITLLHFRYGCRAETREMKAIRDIAEALGCDYRFEDLDWLKQLGGSSLTDDSMEITRNETGVEFAHEWVPARNLIMTSLAAGLCDRYGYDTLALGLNLEESGAYPDNTVEFYRTLDQVLNIGTTSRPRLLSPLANMVKHEIVRLAVDIEAPIHLSWSCYHGRTLHCGECGPCYMRRTAFKIIGEPDSVQYAN